MKKNIFFTLLYFFFLMPGFLNAQVSVQDSLALVDLYNSTGGPNWNTKTNWLSSAKLKDWYGVSVSGGRVKWLYLQSNNLTGNLPSSFTELTAMTKVYFTNNNLSGNIPQNIGNLTALTYLTFYNNNFSGEIPASIGNLASLTDLNLQKNDLSGEIPESIGNLLAINELNLGYNNLTGSIPASIGNLINLEKLYLAENNLSGSIPLEIGTLTALKTVIIFGNNLSGNIPAEIGTLTALENLNLQHNELTGEIPDEIGNLTSLTYLDLGGNNLTGEIPSSIGNLTVLRDLYLFENNFTGEIPSTTGNLSELQTLLLNKNNLTENIPTSIKNLPKLYWLDLKDNQFLFSGLEQFAPLDLSYFIYSPQDTITLKKNSVNNNIELSMEVGGTKTTYQWFYEGTELTGETNQKITILPQNEMGKYYCEAKNSLLPDLTLTGYVLASEIKCWELGQLKFCLNSGSWKEGEEPNQITSTSIISINSFLYFNGTMTIDTSALEVTANGEFYVDNIPLAKDLGIGKYSLGEGKYNLKLSGDEEKITDFLNSELSKTAMIFGTPLKIDDLQFFKRNDTIGIKVNSSVTLPLLSAGCGTPGIYVPETELALKDLEITNKGILSAGFQVDNLGFLSQGCLKNASLSYDWKRDVLIGGAEVSVSYFGDVGAGVKIKEGKIDSVAWKIDSNSKPIPVYATIGVKGFSGHFAGLNNVDNFSQLNLNKLDIKIGGIFTDFITDNFYLAEVDGRIRMDGLFETNGSLQLMQPPGDFLPYQISGSGSMKLDYASKQLGFDFAGKFGTITGESWLADAWGGFSVSYRNNEPKASSHFSADITLQKLPDKYPLNYLNTLISMLGTVGSRNVVCEDDPTHVYGLMYHKSEGFSLCSFNYKIDITKNWYQSGYIEFPEKNRIYITIEEKSGVLEGDVSKIFTVPEKNDFGVIEIKSQNALPVSSITSPNGEKYSLTSVEDNILYTESVDKKEAFWTMFDATPGDWTITLNNPALEDSIITHFYLKEKDFKFSMNQTGNTVTVSWDIAQVNEGQTINLLLDDDNVDFNGFKITEGIATLGSLSFILDESTPKCNYHLIVQLIDEFNIIETYAENTIENPLASLAPPQNFTSTYNSETGEFEFYWDQNSLSSIAGYILTLTDPSGKDSVYAILHSNESGISLFIEDYFNKTVKIESYNLEYEIGCSSQPVKLLTSNENDFRFNEPSNKLNVYPNPTNGNCVIRYFVSEPSDCEIQIFDIQGKQIAQPLYEFKTAGFHQFDFKYDNLPNGIYLIKYINKKESFTVKSVLSK